MPSSTDPAATGRPSPHLPPTCTARVIGHGGRPGRRTSAGHSGPCRNGGWSCSGKATGSALKQCVLSLLGGRNVRSKRLYAPPGGMRHNRRSECRNLSASTFPNLSASTNRHPHHPHAGVSPARKAGGLSGLRSPKCSSNCRRARRGISHSRDSYLLREVEEALLLLLLLLCPRGTRAVHTDPRWRPSRTTDGLAALRRFTSTVEDGPPEGCGALAGCPGWCLHPSSLPGGAR
jgi:hypothetical protein